MILDSALRKELGRSFGATLVVLLTIVITLFLIRTLGEAAGGRIPPGDVVLLLSFTALGHLPTLLALSLFIATVATLSRMYRDSEMAIWFASGVGLRRFVAPCVRMALPVWAVIALLALWMWPQVNARSDDLRQRYAERSDIARVAPGKFQSSRDGSKVFFVEKAPEEQEIGRQVFVMERSAAGETVVTAQRGELQNRPEGRFVVLQDGNRHEMRADGSATRARFSSYELLSGDALPSAQNPLRHKARSSWDLWSQPQDALGQGELAWRLGLIFGAINLLLLGIGLAAANPRRASNWNLLTALLSFVVYFNAINLSQAWVAQGRMSLPLALLILHGTAFALSWSLLIWRDHAITWLTWLQRFNPRRAPETA